MFAHKLSYILSLINIIFFIFAPCQFDPSSFLFRKHFALNDNGHQNYRDKWAPIPVWSKLCLFTCVTLFLKCVRSKKESIWLTQSVLPELLFFCLSSSFFFAFGPTSSSRSFEQKTHSFSNWLKLPIHQRHV